MISHSSVAACCRHAIVAAALLGADVRGNRVLAQPGADERVAGQEPASLGIADVEQAFWTCDYVATVYGYLAFDGHLCATWTDALRDRKFGGDFERLLAWWRDNKHREHERHRLDARAVR